MRRRRLPETAATCSAGGGGEGEGGPTQREEHVEQAAHVDDQHGVAEVDQKVVVQVDEMADEHQNVLERLQLLSVELVGGAVLRRGAQQQLERVDQVGHHFHLQVDLQIAAAP